MTRYRRRTPASFEAFLWLGDNRAAAVDFLSNGTFSTEQTLEDSDTLTISDSSGSTRWFIAPDTYFFVVGNNLKLVPRKKFEDLYEEAS